MLYTGVCTRTFSSGAVSLRTMLESAGTTPVQNTSSSNANSTPCRSLHQARYASRHESGTVA